MMKSDILIILIIYNINLLFKYCLIFIKNFNPKQIFLTKSLISKFIYLCIYIIYLIKIIIFLNLLFYAKLYIILFLYNQNIYDIMYIITLHQF